MRILVTGGQGQLGRALQSVLTEHRSTSVDLPEADVTYQESVIDAVRQSGAELVIHCAAYTDVDGCARDPELAHRVNALGTQNVALACRSTGADMVHLSTNEVFAGTVPGGYEEWMPLEPVNAYGRSKAAAEAYVTGLLEHYYIVRTAWLFARGGRNFIHAILRRAHSQGQIRVVVDEIGNPTYVNDLARAIARLIGTGRFGVYHLTNAGSCSRWQFAQTILDYAGLSHVTNSPIPSSQYGRASTPPLNGALKNTAAATLGITLRPWQEALAEYMAAEL
jgi:dTDP-4-dehydrorhamnose reductase